MLFIDYLKRYLRETSVHGFRYIIEGNGYYEKILWIVSIISSFLLATVMVRENLLDATSHPILTSTNTIPIQDVPFPAVTLSGVYLWGSGRLPETIMNNMKFDCINEDEACVQETAQLRTDTMKMIKSLVRFLYHSFVIPDSWFPNSEEYLLHEYFCGNLLPIFDSQMYSLVLGLAQLYSQSGNIKALENEVLDVVALSFRMPIEDILKKLISFFTILNKEHLLTEASKNHCLEDFKNANLSRKAMTFSLKNIFFSGLFDQANHRPMYEMYLGSILARDPNNMLILLDGLNTTHTMSIEKEPKNLMKKLQNIYSKMMGNLTMFSVKSILFYLKYAWFFAKFDEQDLLECHLLENNIFNYNKMRPVEQVQFCAKNSTSPCCNFESQISKEMDVIYRVMKYTVAPPSGRVIETGEKQDLELVKDLGYKIHNMYLTNSNPVFIACKYGKMPLVPHCNLFRKLFTTTGIGYTFNNEPFSKMYKKTKDSMAFHAEIYDLEDSDDKNIPRKISSNGQGHSLEFILKHDKVLLDNFEGQKLVVHDPSAIADIRNEAIELQPGMAYELSVTPSVTVTDNRGLQLKPDQRNCLSGSEHDKLDIFGLYSQYSCFFECQLKKAVDACNCTAWDYPRINSKVNLCWHRVVKACFDKQMELSDLLNCNCPNDCSGVYYSVSIQAYPLKHLCSNIGKQTSLTRKIKEHLDNLTIQEQLDMDLATRYNTCARRRKESTTFVRISVSPKTVSQMVRTSRVTFSGQLASLGGIIGLFPGMSILSLAEIMFWTLRFVKSLLKFNLRS